MKKLLFILLAVISVSISFPQIVDATNPSSAIVYQDNRTIKGVVLDVTGEPLVGATIRIKGTKIAVVTDRDGRYVLTGVSNDAIICCSYVGYNSQEKATKDYSDVVDFVMEVASIS